MLLPSGCIVKAAWNPDGAGIRPIAPAFAAFANAKRNEFFRNCATSALVCVLVVAALVRAQSGATPSAADIGVAVGATAVCFGGV